MWQESAKNCTWQKVRGGTARLRLETGRWCGLRRDERVREQFSGNE